MLGSKPRPLLSGMHVPPPIPFHEDEMLYCTYVAVLCLVLARVGGNVAAKL